MTISPENVLKREDFELPLMKARSKLWDCHGIFKLFVSDNWLVKDRGQGQDYLHFRRQPELGDDGLLLTLEILNHERRDGQQGVLIEVIIAHSPAIGLLAIRPEDISGMRIVNCVDVWISRCDVSDIPWWSMRSDFSPGWWWLSGNCPRYYRCCHCPRHQSPSPQQCSINCDTNDMDNMGNVDTKLADHVFLVWEENLLNDFLRGRKSKLINILALMDWALYARISE